MKFSKRHLSALIAALLLLASMSGCSKDSEKASSDTSSSQGSSEVASDTSSNSVASDETGAETEANSFDYSGGIDEKGYWEGIVAKELVEDFEYKGISVPNDTHNITEEAIQGQIDTFASSFPTVNQIKDRAVADGDKVNIDYVGSVDGVEFEGGTTNGEGSEVIIGETSFIDDFIAQIVGHTPGETFNIEVTFPAEYPNSPDLQSKDAVFVTTINYISESVPAEVNDEFVTTNLSAEYGWKTVAEMKDGVQADLKKQSIRGFLSNYLAGEVSVDSTPEVMTKYQEDSMLAYYESYAQMYGVGIDEFLAQQETPTTVEELKENSAKSNEERARYFLVVQAVAEDAEIVPTDEETEAFYKESFADYKETYGMPFLKQNVLTEKVLDLLVEKAVLA